MKKAFALVLAVAMVMSMAAVSFAAVGALVPNDPDSTDADKVFTVDGPFTYDKDTKEFNEPTGDKFEYGDTVYVRLISDEGASLAEEKSGAGLKASAKWTEGGAYIEGVEVVKIKVENYGGVKIYAVAISTTGEETKDVNVDGTVYLKGKSGSADGMTSAQKKVDHKFDLAFTLGYESETVAGDSVTVAEDDGKKVFKMADCDEEELTIDYDSVAEVVVNAKNEKNVILAIDTDYIEEIDEAYPDANIDYVALTGAFKKTAEVKIFADEDAYLYEVVDGKVVEVDAEYDDWEEAFVFKTRKLGTYVVSDAKLNTAAAVVATNPTTGAAA